MAQVYISYASGKSVSGPAVIAERIETELKRHFGKRVSIFREAARSTEQNFAALDRELKDTRLLVAVLDDTWNNADAAMRHEIEAMLNAGVQTLVVLTSDTLPPPDALPATLHDLYNLTSVQITPDNFYADLRETIAIVERMVSRPNYTRGIFVAILSVFVLIMCGFAVVVALSVSGDGVTQSANPTAIPTETLVLDDDPADRTATEVDAETEPTERSTSTSLIDATALAATAPANATALAVATSNTTTDSDPTPTRESGDGGSPQDFQPTQTPTPTPLPTDTAAPTQAPTLDLGDSEVSIIEAETADEDQLNALGDASVYVFHDLDYTEREPLNIALQLFFDTVNITATPRSPVTAVPVTQEATRPNIAPISITETPAPARFVTQVPDVPPVVVASLLCPDGFRGCGDHPDRFRLRIDQPNEWAWAVFPQDDALDIAQFTVQLWRADENGDKTNERLLSYSMSLGTTGSTNILAPLAVAGVVVLGAGVALVAWRMGQRRSILMQTDSIQPLKPTGPVPANRPSAFISYRRSPSWGVALKIHDTLSARGANVFMDVHDLRDGRFSETLEHEIKTRDYLILLLAPSTLESEWVRREVRYALDNQRVIIPVLTDGFDFERDLPEDLKEISSFNAITLTLEYYDAAINRIATFLGVE